MSSILTNNSAMVALQTLRTINKDLAATQSEVSTGKKVSNARDNAAIWAVSAVMEADVAGFKAISETLAIGASTLNVARDGAETVGALLEEMKGRIVAAQQDNVDRTKIQADVSELVSQVVATVDASQFNGLNLLAFDSAQPEIEILGSLNRTDTGVETSSIIVDRQVLESTGNLGGVVNTTTGTTARATADDGGFGELFENSETDSAVAAGVDNGADFAVTIAFESSPTGADDIAAIGTTVALAVGDIGASFTVTQEWIDEAKETAGASDATSVNTELSIIAAREIAADLTQVVTDAGIADDYTVADPSGANTFNITNNSGVEVESVIVAGNSQTPLELIDVSTKAGAASALNMIEDMIQGAIDSAAAFGSSGKRVDIQADFVKKISDSLKSGIGAMVDADMEETSARLQALQVQQQLGVQSLSIANQQPQSLLSLFR